MNSLKTYWQVRKPLGWAQLSHRKMRLLVALMGVAFSNILIFTQLGLRAMLFDGVTLVPDHLQGDLFLVSAYYSVNKVFYHSRESCQFGF